MKRKLQVILNEDAWAALETLTKEANDGFTTGSINMSDIVNEVLQTAKIDIRGLQAKHVNVRLSLRQMASQKDIDIDLAIKSLMEMKANGNKRPAKQQTLLKGVDA